MDILGSIGNIMSLGSFAINLFANNRKRQLYQQQQGYYEWEAEINRRIGQLNAQAAEYSGKQAVSAIAAQTKKILGKQLVEFSNRGIELEGSPSFVMGETETMGSREAQNNFPILLLTNRCCRGHSLARTKFNPILHLSDQASLSKNWF